MFTDQQLRQRADQLREQLKVTMLQTRNAIESTRKLTDQTVGRHKRQSQDRSVVRTIGNLRNTREKLDALRLR